MLRMVLIKFYLQKSVAETAGSQKKYTKKCVASVVGQTPTAAALLHTGYLTIDSISRQGKTKIFHLKLPNKEMADDFSESLGNILFPGIDDEDVKYDRSASFRSAAAAKDADALTGIINSVYAGIASKHHRSNESFYCSILRTYCLALFERAAMEESGAKGDTDLVVDLGQNAVAVIELKYDPEEKNAERALDRLARNALKQIKEKQYGRQYRKPGTAVFDIGLGVVGRGQAKAVFGGGADAAG
jgi:hypothetical protein